MAEKMPAMPFYGKDFYDDSKVKVLSLAAQGLYLALLWRQWVDGHIPTDFKNMARLVGHSESEVKKLWPEIKQFFTKQGDGGVNAKLEKVRRDLEERRAKYRKGANTANAKRWSKRSPSDAVTDAPSDTISDTSSDSVGHGNGYGNGISSFTEGEREGKPQISYGQFMFLATKVAEWQRETDGMYVGAPGASADAFFRRFNISWSDFEALRDSFRREAK